MAKRILILLLVTTLAGCSQSDADPPTVEGPVDIGGHHVAAGMGLVTGRVESDSGLRIQGARVSLLGTQNFTDSNATGAFALTVPPGEYELQVQADGFRVHVEAIRVAAGQETHVIAALVPQAGLLPTERPHVHDLWRGRQEVTLVDLEYDLRQRPGFRGGADPYDPPGMHWQAILVEPNVASDGAPIPILENEDGSPAIVYPGASRIEVTFDWTVNEDTTKDTLALEYRGPNMDRTQTDPGPPGTTWTIPINQTQVDGGHEEWTAWRFTIKWPGPVYNPATWDPGVNIGSVHVVIKFFRGQDPPLEPAHQDHFAGASHFVVQPPAEWSYGGAPTSNRETFEWRPENIVPPGTARLWVKFQWRFENVAVGLLGDDYNLMWRTAAQNPFTTPWSEYVIGTPIEAGDGFKIYEFDVAAAETDQYYAAYSDWGFSPYRPGHETEASDYGVMNRDRVFDIEIVAYAS